MAVKGPEFGNASLHVVNQCGSKARSQGRAVVGLLEIAQSQSLHSKQVELRGPLFFSLSKCFLSLSELGLRMLEMRQ